MTSILSKIIIIEGPTAIGKSNFAHQLASHLPVEIISADSRQIYRYLDIGTAKPSHALQARYHYHGIDVVTPDQIYSAGKFVKDADATINTLISRDKIPVLVGGTGFYIQSLLTGLFQAPPIPAHIKTELNQQYEKEGFFALYHQLQQIDPTSAKRIAKNDKNRLLRALEIWKSTGKPISEHWKEQQQQLRYNAFRILLTQEREPLYKQINERVLKMIKKGLVEEFFSLIEMGYTAKDPGMNTVGYKELFGLIETKKKEAEIIQTIQKNTRHYAKRQFTWYRKQVFDLTLHPLCINFSEVKEKIQNWLMKTKG